MVKDVNVCHLLPAEQIVKLLLVVTSGQLPLYDGNLQRLCSSLLKSWLLGGIMDLCNGAGSH